MNRTYSRNIIAACFKCGNKININESVSVNSEFILDDESDSKKISIMNIYGVEHSHYACTKCGINMNICDKVIFDLFSELCKLPMNVYSIDAAGCIGGCIGSITSGVDTSASDVTFAYPSIIFYNSNIDIINGILDIISNIIGSYRAYSNIRIQINPISSVEVDEENNSEEHVDHYQVIIYINDDRFTNSKEKYHMATNNFIKFLNLITDPIKSFRLQEEKKFKYINKKNSD